VDAPLNRIFHFFSYKITSVWEFKKNGTKEDKHSTITGMGLPQTVTFDNWNQTTAFKGDHETTLRIALTPTVYANEHGGMKKEGYRVHMKDVEPGSVVNKRTMLLPFSQHSNENKGFHLHLEFEESRNIFNVRNIKKMSLLELIAFCLAILCGFIIIARVVKSCFGSKNYFKAIDRETVMLFGDSNNLVLDEKFKREAAIVEERNK